jgi:two-component system, OmpR family, sensor kinase
MTLPIKARLTLAYVALFALIVGAWSVFVVLLVQADLYRSLDRALALRASQIAQDLNAGEEADFQDITDSTLSGIPPSEAVAQLLSSDGTVLGYSGDAAGKTPIVGVSGLRGIAVGESVQVQSMARGRPYRILVVRLRQTPEFVLVGASTDSADITVRRVALVMLLTGPLALLAAGASGWYVSRRALRPVAKMTSTAARIGIDRLGHRLPVPRGKDELSALARTLNTMLDRLQTGVQEKHRLVADASHELQTPLAVMRTELDVSLASPDLPADAVDVLESAREEVDRMTRIVRNLLTLARFDEGTLRLLLEPVNLQDLVARTAESLATLARERGVNVEVTGEQAMVSADTEYLRIVVTNLLENAVKYSPEGGMVRVETHREGGDAILSVEDHGAGVPEEAREHVFDRFYRIDGARTKGKGGSGLGLAISREVVEAHGGRIELTSEVGKGSCFTVRLPEAGKTGEAAPSKGTGRAGRPV